MRKSTLLIRITEVNFSHNFQIKDLNCLIAKVGDMFDFRINNNSFSHLYNLQNNKMFYGGKDDLSTHSVGQPKERKSNFGLTLDYTALLLKKSKERCAFQF